jgi:hypothetical protein
LASIKQKKNILPENKKMANDVDYYNKVITKNNKEITKYCNGDPISSSGLASLSASPLEGSQPMPVALQPADPPQGGIETAALDFGEDTITYENVKRAIIQLWHNAGELREWKLKVRLNLDFGQGEETADFICPLNKDWGNYTKHHPQVSKFTMIEWARPHRKMLKDVGINPYLGKFHNTQGTWRQGHQKFNQNEPWSCSIVWYDKDKTSWFAYVKIYSWEEIIQLTKQGLKPSQAKCKAQKIWMNPQHYQIQRPLTWAEQRAQRMKK